MVPQRHHQQCRRIRSKPTPSWIRSSAIICSLLEKVEGEATTCSVAGLILVSEFCSLWSVRNYAQRRARLRSLPMPSISTRSRTADHPMVNDAPPHSMAGQYYSKRTHDRSVTKSAPECAKRQMCQNSLEPAITKPAPECDKTASRDRNVPALVELCPPYEGRVELLPADLSATQVPAVCAPHQLGFDSGEFPTPPGHIWHFSSVCGNIR